MSVPPAMPCISHQITEFREPDSPIVQKDQIAKKPSGKLKQHVARGDTLASNGQELMNRRTGVRVPETPVNDSRGVEKNLTHSGLFTNAIGAFRSKPPASKTFANSSNTPSERKTFPLRTAKARNRTSSFRTSKGRVRSAKHTCCKTDSASSCDGDVPRYLCRFSTDHGIELSMKHSPVAHARKRLDAHLIEERREKERTIQ